MTKESDTFTDGEIFISYYPLKQGLKHFFISSLLTTFPSFISYYPLKQGLKHADSGVTGRKLAIYILLSIKTRIETARRRF